MAVDSQVFDLEVIREGEKRYESARLAAVVNGLKPTRFPAAIALPRNEHEVVLAVQLANQQGWRITVRSGGHSWTGSHLRNGALLIDMSRMQRMQVEASSMSAIVEAGATVDTVLSALTPLGLIFPTGTTHDVGMGGYLLGGGFGWLMREVGPAAQSVVAIDVVTAGGEVVHADAGNNSDLYWAARGSGPGFFGVITRFYLKLYGLPPVLLRARHVYGLTELEGLFRWMYEVPPLMSRRMTLSAHITSGLPGVDGVGFLVETFVMASTVEEAEAGVALLDTCPVRHLALSATVEAVTPLGVAREAQLDVTEHFRIVADNMWTGAGIEELLNVVRRLVETMPPPPSHAFWMVWGPRKPLQEMFLDQVEDVYLAVYSAWLDPAEDALFDSWPSTMMGEFEGLSTGLQVNDEGMDRRSSPIASQEHLARFEQIRAKWDPHNRFHHRMGPDLDV